MKKLLLTIILAAILLFSTAALAEEIILPDPGYYFGRSYDGCMIEFDEYPKAEFDAYTTLLINKYGLEITDAYSGKYDEFFFMKIPGVENSKVFVSCFQDSEGVFGMEFDFGQNITLRALDVYNARSSSEPGVIAWDDGRMIADPGDFLGYEIKVTDILDMTFYRYGGNYFERFYDEIAMEDILKYIDALDASPYFELCSTGDAKSKYASYRVINFLYTGPDEELAELCEASHKNKRTCDLYVLIEYRDRERSTFRIVSYPGFIVNSADYVSEPTPNPDDPDDLFETCGTCFGDGKCNICDGRGKQRFYNATQGWYEVDCSCNSGRCRSCNGSGHK